jgi:SAM-dependent methyltransferase
MTEVPLIWHYGLMAERWAETIKETPELLFLEETIARFGQPVLDVACGTGRLLLPLLRAGIDIDGCDISGDMLQHCQRQALAEGFHPQLLEQPMSAFEMPRLYKTIYICGSFGLAGSRGKDLATLQCCHAHLETGGALLMNIQADYAAPESWQMWLPENRRQLPEAWPQEGNRRVAADGSVSVAYLRTVDLDPLEQRYTRQVRLEKWVDGAAVASEEYTLQGTMYFKNEVMLMLEMAGFDEITVQGDYGSEEATSEHKELVFTAIK